MSVDLEVAFAEKDLKLIMDAYMEIPSGIRHLLQGRVVRWVWTRAALWSKCEHLSIRHHSLTPFAVIDLRETIVLVFDVLPQLEHTEQIDSQVHLIASSSLCLCSCRIYHA